MPIHDWTRVFAGAFHHFHHEWISEIQRALNRGLLPSDYYAMAEQVMGRRGDEEEDEVGRSQPDVLTLQIPGASAGGRNPAAVGGGVAVADAPPKIRFRSTTNASLYAAKAKAVVVRHQSGHEVVAVIELVSPGNKANTRDFRAFVDKTQGLLAAGIHVLVVDLFPPTRRDPEGLHPEIFGEEGEDDSAEGGGRPFRFSPAKPLTCASYVASRYGGAYVEPLAVGDPLPDAMPVFLTRGRYVPVPLEATYRAAFDAVPAVWRAAVEAGTAR
jgi:hypothetical protein